VDSAPAHEDIDYARRLAGPPTEPPVAPVVPDLYPENVCATLDTRLEVPMQYGQVARLRTCSYRSLVFIPVVLCLSLFLSGCAAALEGGLVEGALIRGIPAGVTEVGLAEGAAMAARVGLADGVAVAARAGLADGVAMGARAGAAESVGARTFVGASDGLATTGRIAAADGTAARMAGMRSAGTAVLTEARIASIASRSGLGGVLEEMTTARPFIDSVGRISVNGRTILTAGDTFIRLPSSGQALGQIRSTRLFALDTLGRPLIEIGELSTSAQGIASDMPIQVVRVRPDWYRVIIGSQVTAGSDVLLALVGDRDRSDKKPDVDEEYLKQQAPRLRARIEALLTKR
jgi:hypothetical protein